MGSQQGQEENVRLQRNQVGPRYGEGVSALIGGRPEREMSLSGHMARSQGLPGGQQFWTHGERPPHLTVGTT